MERFCKNVDGLVSRVDRHEMDGVVNNFVVHWQSISMCFVRLWNVGFLAF